ncbi:MAG: hypothetical protein JSW61_14220 [Candidatus Thorarchaeota archaeon]|nr:MAG: hypothetical protein JSW61_14220 [Candidatus Thorarchaeota archaeon]
MTEHSTATLRFIDRELRRIEISKDNVIVSYPLNALPDRLFQRLAGLTESSDYAGEGLEFIYRDTVSKPAMCTFTLDLPFSLNFALKVVRLTLSDNEIEDRIDDLEGEVLSLQGQPFQETVADRLELYKQLYLDESKIDQFRLGAVEMFGATTYTNILRDPRVCLGFNWYDDTTNQHYGLQLNCIAEVVTPENPFFRFMRLLRQLFSSRFLDLQSPDYVCGYKLWVSEVFEKNLESTRGFLP